MHRDIHTWGCLESKSWMVLSSSSSELGSEAEALNPLPLLLLLRHWCELEKSLLICCTFLEYPNWVLNLKLLLKLVCPKTLWDLRNRRPEEEDDGSQKKKTDEEVEKLKRVKQWHSATAAAAAADDDDAKTAIVTAAAAATTTTVSYQKPYAFQQFLWNPGSLCNSLQIPQSY